MLCPHCPPRRLLLLQELGRSLLARNPRPPPLPSSWKRQFHIARVQQTPRQIQRRLASRSVTKRIGQLCRAYGTVPESRKVEDPSQQPNEPELHESPYTLPNALTLARILACPWLGYEIIHEEYAWATGILFASGLSDWLDGYLARNWGGQSVLGSILDPAADKALMTTLVVTLAYSGLLPIPLAVLILGRDVALSISAFYFRFISLPRPRTLKRYFDPSIPSAEVKPTQISKINTALQLLLMGVTTVSPLIHLPLGTPLTLLQWTVAGTTIWSGFSYLGRSGVKILGKQGK
ncbi:CDP-alcohol phosphatidyltransferase-domain-containing protein [Kockovaella imperatae]|uniref:CDP-alcohol phosphatidyltransferase-domain-containing protein n=1 Tax=Kockovaella imperatae TaxID=4999 RepID=A0A1Y1U7E7_9TREE|nr:CDP-alcohol phosphatidyltransferase-domain-containing protein [Kockovaella imperatae]ORX33464.1 CDP-alcohol phosphatidyltransferase-domain-containing protein [Kockovaella imperatae]